MRQLQQLGGVLFTGAAVLLTAKPVWAEATQVTAVRLNPTPSGVDVILQTQQGDRPQIFTVSRGNELMADLQNTQLRLPQGNSFRQDNPAPGITSIVVSPLNADSIRVTVSGANNPPSGEIRQAQGKEITLSVSPLAASPRSIPTLGNGNSGQASNVAPAQTAQLPPAQAPPAQTPALPVTPQPIAPAPDVLVPNPKITIDGTPALPAGVAQPNAPAPPFLPRAVAPPVGDIAIAAADSSPQRIDLGTAERVPRLVLRDAPVREVLGLLARSAGLNLAFIAGTPGAPGQAGAPGAAPAAPGQPGAETGPTISLDIENEPVQDVFNYVLQIAGLEANRVGRTVFVGQRLPDQARNVVVRSLRMNQVAVSAAANFLTAQGAETQLPVEQIQIQTIGEGAAARTVEIRTPSILALRATEGSGPLLLRGLSVLTDERLNSITLVGTPRQVEIASSLLTQLDARRRQVAVNVKIVDVNLVGTDAFNTSFSFGIGDSFFSVDAGAAGYNYGGFRPPTSLELNSSLAGQPIIPNPYSGSTVFLDPNSFVNIPGTGVGQRVIRDGIITQDTGTPAGTFLAPIPGVTSDPFRAGITQTTLGTPNVVTTTTTPATPQQGIPGQPGFVAGTPATTTTTFSPGTPGTITTSLPNLFQFPNRFLAALRTQITNGNAKILTDPTLVVQEGQSATVNLTQEVVGNIERETETSDNLTTVTTTAEIKEAGLVLNLRIERIDDNGFITLAVNPRVTSIGNLQDLSIGDDTNQIALLNVRELNSGQIRLRDGQTLILSGIIQQQERTTIRKVPILGDLPIIGALFRSTNRTDERAEVIVLLTPQIIDDSSRASFGYNYTPSPDTRRMLERENFSPPRR